MCAEMEGGQVILWCLGSSGHHDNYQPGSVLNTCRKEISTDQPVIITASSHWSTHEMCVCVCVCVFTSGGCYI